MSSLKPSRNFPRLLLRKNDGGERFWFDASGPVRRGSLNSSSVRSLLTLLSVEAETPANS